MNISFALLHPCVEVFVEAMFSNATWLIKLIRIGPLSEQCKRCNGFCVCVCKQAGTHGAVQGHEGKEVGPPSAAPLCVTGLCALLQSHAQSSATTYCKSLFSGLGFLESSYLFPGRPHEALIRHVHLVLGCIESDKLEFDSQQEACVDSVHVTESAKNQSNTLRDSGDSSLRA